jgi:hypothetical protein
VTGVSEADGQTIKAQSSHHTATGIIIYLLPYTSEEQHLIKAGNLPTEFSFNF